tara:strand:+ start:77 stop:277 length:201 start_codon:yes stop_codon:yes gene_type:complete
MKYENKDGLKLDSVGGDEIITFVKDIINETLKILENPYNLNRVDDTIEFLKENFDLEEQDEGQDEE